MTVIYASCVVRIILYTRTDDQWYILKIKQGGKLKKLVAIVHHTSINLLSNADVVK